MLRLEDAGCGWAPGDHHEILLAEYFGETEHLSQIETCRSHDARLERAA